MNAALRHFEAAEANLVKLEKLWTDIEAAIPNGIQFVHENPEYEDNCRSFESILSSLPKIDGWKPQIPLMDLNEIAQNRLDANEVGDFEGKVSVEQQIAEPSRGLREYRFRFNQKRRQLIREALVNVIDVVDAKRSRRLRKRQIGEALHRFERFQLAR